MLQERRNLMAEKKLTIRVDDTIYEPFKAKCVGNGFKTNDLFVSLMAECNSIIELAIALRDKEIREAKEAQILKLTEELGYTESDVKKLLKNSKPAEAKPAKEEKSNESMHQVHTFDASKPAGSPQSKDCGEVLESRHAHKGTYEDEVVMWEVDRFNTGYFCKTSDGKTHKKDVVGNIVS